MRLYVPSDRQGSSAVRRRHAPRYQTKKSEKCEKIQRTGARPHARVGHAQPAHAADAETRVAHGGVVAIGPHLGQSAGSFLRSVPMGERRRPPRAGPEGSDLFSFGARRRRTPRGRIKSEGSVGKLLVRHAFYAPSDRHGPRRSPSGMRRDIKKSPRQFCPSGSGGTGVSLFGASRRCHLKKTLGCAGVVPRGARKLADHLAERPSARGLLSFFCPHLGGVLFGIS